MNTKTRLLFVLPTKGGGGGAHSVAQEVDELIRFGVDVQIAVNDANAAAFATTYADIPNVCRAVRAYTNPQSLAALFDGVDIVVCTIFTTVETVLASLDAYKGQPPRLAYYVQDYEPLFYPLDDPMREQAFKSYTRLPNAMLYAKTDWIREIVTRNHGVSVEKVQPSLDTEVYYPTAIGREGSVRITAMVRPSTPRRAPRRTMSALKEIEARWGDQVSLNVFGCDEQAFAQHQLPSDFTFTQHGLLSRNQVGALFRQTDIFLDLSDYQAFGRSGLEAMACGCATVLPIFGGSNEYAVDRKNSRLVDTRSFDEIVSAVDWYMKLSPAGLRALKQSAIETSLRYSVRNAAASELQLFERCLHG